MMKTKETRVDSKAKIVGQYSRQYQRMFPTIPLCGLRLD